MSGLDQLLGNALSGGALAKIAGQLGTDEAGAQGALSAVLPQLLGRLQSNASTTEGAEALQGALGQHDGSVLDDVDGYLDRGDQDGSQDRFVSKVFGADRDTTVNALAGQTGFDMSKITSLIGVLGPIVLAAMSKSGAQAGGAGGLAGVLGGLLGGGGAGGMLGSLLGAAGGGSGAAGGLGGTKAASAGAGGVVGKVSGMLDRDGDGNPMNDIQKMAKSSMGQKLLGMLKKKR
jgi:hypothetical protein